MANNLSETNLSIVINIIIIIAHNEQKHSSLVYGSFRSIYISYRHMIEVSKAFKTNSTIQQ